MSYLNKYVSQPHVHHLGVEDIEPVRMIVEVPVKTGDDEEEFYVTQKYKVVGKESRSKKLNKFKNDVGLENVVKKLAKQGIDAGDGRFAAKSGYVDATKLPQSSEDLAELGYQLDPATSAAWKALPKELKGNMDIKTFAQKFDGQMFNNYLNKKFGKKPEVKPEVKQEVKASEGDNK